ncbi:MAG TPA: carboxylate-amine ligase [Acidimicrobiia bacterium]|nr:carboxylate-amine ligase [Acidimicrobiia bacterium]
MPRPVFSLGIEEEYLLVDRQTRNLISDPGPEMWDAAQEALGARAMPEFLRAQLEVATGVHRGIAEAGEELAGMRRTLDAVLARYDAAIMAASTHPFALWWEQQHTDRDRYKVMAEDMGMVARRMVICGMHVHAGIDDPDLRIDLMNQVRYFLPHLLTLSTSSPFWGSHLTGLKSFRISTFRTMPRTGLPEEFDSWTEYQRHVDVLVRAHLIDDSSKIWWDVRPSARFPTLEMRITDVCTRVEDAVTVAAIYLSLLHMLYRLRRNNQRWRQYAPMLISENIWRAQRYGIDGTLMDFGKGVLVPYEDLLEEMIELVRPDAEELGCVEQVEHARTIVEVGTSADHQIRIYQAAIAGGASNEEALRSVVDYLIADTQHGV